MTAERVEAQPGAAYSLEDYSDMPQTIHWSKGRDAFMKAWVKMQADLLPVSKDGSAEHYNYATLDGMIAMLRPIIAKHGFGFTQHLSNERDNLTLTIVVFHESGQWMSSTLDVPIAHLHGSANAVQMQGAGITYMRKYQLAAVFTLTTEEDTDARSFQGQGRQTRQSRQPRQTRQNRQSARPTVPNPYPSQPDEPESQSGLQPGTSAYFMTDSLRIKSGSSGKPYISMESSENDKSVNWFKGRRALLEAMPWIGEYTTYDSLGKMGSVHEIPLTKVTGTVNDKGFLKPETFELQEEGEADMVWRDYHGKRYIVTNNYNVTVPAFDEDTPLGTIREATAILEEVIETAKKSGHDKAQELADDKLTALAEAGF